MTVTPCLLLPLDLTEVGVRADRQRAKFARAAARVAAGEVPRCAWAGGHRYDLLKIENGQRVEVCMDCGGGARAYPADLSSRYAKPYELASGKILEWPHPFVDARVGAAWSIL